MKELAYQIYDPQGVGIMEAPEICRYPKHIELSLLEAGYSIRLNGKRITKNVYAKTREDCEKKLMVLIAQMDQKILAQKARMVKDIE